MWRKAETSSSILDMKPEDIDSAEKRGSYTVCVVSCGRIGLLQACLFAEAGFKVVCADTNQALVNSLARGKAPFLKHQIEPILRKCVKSGFFKATNDIKMAVSQSNVAVIATQTKVDENGKVNYSDIESTCKLIGSGLHKDILVVVISIVGHGITEELIKEVLERVSGLKVGADFYLAYSPVQVLEDETLDKMVSHPRIVAGVGKSSLDAASTILETITKKGVAKAGDVRTAEATTLFRAMERVTKLGLANEVAMLCEKAGIDYLKVQKLAGASNGNQFVSPTLDGGENSAELQMMFEEAESLNTKLRIATIAKEVNEESLRHAINLIHGALKASGRPLRSAKIAFLGISKTSNATDMGKDSVKALAKMLEKKAVKLRFYDPYASDNEQIEFEYPLKKSLTEAVEGANCIAILVNHEQFARLNLKKLKAMVKMPAAIVDFVGVLEPEKLEMEGFIYRGLGRGVWKK
jgi:nucleotide sugar dehydrogenase